MLVVHGPVTQLRSRRHNQQFHGLPEVEVQILVPTGHETRDLISIYVEGNEFAVLYTPIHDDLMEGGVALSYEVDWLSVDIHSGKWEEAEFDTLVHHVHCCKPTRLNIVPHVVGSYSYLVNERGILCAGSSSQNRREKVIVVQRKLYITCRDPSGVNPQFKRRLTVLSIFRRSQNRLQIVFGSSDPVLCDDNVWSEIELDILLIFCRCILLEVQALNLVHSLDLSNLSLHHHADSLLTHQLVDGFSYLLSKGLMNLRHVRVNKYDLRVLVANRVKI